MAYKAEPLRYDGAIDADGHVLEPVDLFEEYLEVRYRSRALRIQRDENGLEYLEIDGRKSKRTNSGTLGTLGRMGEEEKSPSADRLYADHSALGAADPDDRMSLLDQENLDGVILYPTLQLLWECELEDAELSLAYQSAYNRWIADFCRGSKGRLVPIAHVSLMDPEASAAELERAVRDGCMGAFIAPFTHSRVPPGHQDHDPLFITAAKLGVPLAIHPTLVPGNPNGDLFKWSRSVQAYASSLHVRSVMQQAFASFIAYGTLERVPDLKLGILETGCGWIGSLLDRLDSLTDAMSLPGRRKPSRIFRDQCFISADPDERAASKIVEAVGSNNFIWATDYPHPDHPEGWTQALEALVQPLAPDTRAKLLGDNARSLYNLE